MQSVCSELSIQVRRTAVVQKVRTAERLSGLLDREQTRPLKVPSSGKCPCQTAPSSSSRWSSLCGLKSSRISGGLHSRAWRCVLAKIMVGTIITVTPAFVLCAKLIRNWYTQFRNLGSSCYRFLLIFVVSAFLSY